MTEKSKFGKRYLVTMFKKTFQNIVYVHKVEKPHRKTCQLDIYQKL